MSALPINTLTPKEFADRVNVSTSSLRRWEREGVIKSIRTASGHRRFSENDIIVAQAHQAKVQQDRVHSGQQRIKSSLETHQVSKPIIRFHKPTFLITPLPKFNLNFKPAYAFAALTIILIISGVKFLPSISKLSNSITIAFMEKNINRKWQMSTKNN